MAAHRLAQMLTCESAFNDPTAAIITFAILRVAMGAGEFSLAATLLTMLQQAVLGIAAGLVLGYLASGNS